MGYPPPPVPPFDVAMRRRERLPLSARRSGRATCELCGEKARYTAVVDGEYIEVCSPCYEAVDQSGAIDPILQESSRRGRKARRLLYA